MNNHSIHGLAIDNFLSIKTAHLGPLGKINVLVGPNNSGKSNVLRFMNESLSTLVDRVRTIDHSVLQSRPHTAVGGQTSGSIGIHATLSALERLFSAAAGTGHQLAEAVYKHISADELVWLSSRWPPRDVVTAATQWADPKIWHAVWHAITRSRGGNLQDNWIPECLNTLRQLVPSTVTVCAIPILRSARAEKNYADGIAAAGHRILGGAGAIAALAQMQNPEAETYETSKKRFMQVQAFVRTVTGDETAEIHVPHGQDQILVRFRSQRFFPLAQLGSGIEQVVLHAIAATSVSNSIITFEEPELHLHPTLQRQLMLYLTGTENQYFISTHSAHIIDAAHLEVFHVRLTDDASVVERVTSTAHRHRICDELGYRPSDLVQTNCIIWVEGPSDRIYLKYWLGVVDASLKENIHFSIMFYGGKLLSHLSASEFDQIDKALDDVIQLRPLNRRVAVLMDSDLTSKSGEIRSTKKRVKEEIERHGGFVWITAGRELENYIPTAHLTSAVDAISPGRGSAVVRGTFARVLPTVKARSKQTVDKVSVARAVSKLECDLHVLDLNQRILELCNFVRSSNGIPTLDQ